MLLEALVVESGPHVGGAGTRMDAGHRLDRRCIRHPRGYSSATRYDTTPKAHQMNQVAVQIPRRTRGPSGS